MNEANRSSERFFFAHLLKTAGTELLFQFRHQFGEFGVYPHEVDGGPERVLDISLLEQSIQNRGDQIHVIAGHFPLATVDLLPGHYITLTILREPVERTLSFLRHQKAFNPDERELALEAIYDDPERFKTLVHNHMVKMLAMPADILRPGGMLTEMDATADGLERAKQALSGVDVVGLQDRYREFSGELEARFGWDLGPERHANTTQPEPVSEAFRQRIAADNALDVELYEFGVELVDKRRASS